MSDFTYRDGQLYAEDISLSEIAKRYATPCYVYSNKSIQSKYLEFNSAFGSEKHLICYAVKANSNTSILSILAKLGSGFDIVSSGELFRVLKAGGSPDRIVFSGVGKSKDEMKFALEQNIKCFNVESRSELTKLSKVAKNMKLVAPVSLRVNPDVDAKTHPYIATGLKENKFGIAFESAKDIFKQAENDNSIKLIGIDYVGIGSDYDGLDCLPRGWTDCMDHLKIAEHLDKRGYFQGFMGTQADKSIEAINTFLDLFNDMPEKENRIHGIRSGLVQSINSSKPGFRARGQAVSNWVKQGYSEDPNRSYYEKYKVLSFDDILSFYSSSIKKEPIVITIVTDKRKIDIEELSRFGKVIDVTKKDIFN